MPEAETLRRDLAIRERERDTLAATAKQTGEAARGAHRRARAARGGGTRARHGPRAPGPARARGARAHRAARGTARRVDRPRAVARAAARRRIGQARAPRLALARAPRAPRRAGVIPDSLPTLRFAFDGATDWPPDEPLRVLAGWCFGDGTPVRGIELRIGGVARTVDYGLPRADVAALHPDRPGRRGVGLSRRARAPTGAARHCAGRAARRRGPCSAPREVDRRRVRAPARQRRVSGLDAPSAGPRARVRMVLPSAGTRRPRRRRAARRDARVPLSVPAARRRARVRRPVVGRAQRLRGPRRRAARAATRSRSPANSRAAKCCRSRAARSSTCCRIRAFARAGRALRARLRAVAGIAAMARAWIDPTRRPPGSARLAQARAQVVANAARRGGARPGLPGGFAVPPVADRYATWLEWNRWSDRRAAWLAARLASTVSLPTISIVMPVYRPDRQVARPGDRDRRGAGARAMGALHRRRRERRRRADPSSRVARRARSADQGRPPCRERQHQPGHELGGGARDRRFPALPRPGRRARARRARRDRARARRGARRGSPLHRRRQGRRRRPPLRAAVQAGLVARAPAVVHVLLARVRRAPDALRRARWLSRGFEGSQDYDFALRASERARRIVHVPLVLYHWRATPGSTATLRRGEAGELRGRAAGDRRGARATRKPRPRGAAGMGGARGPRALHATRFPTTDRASRS